MQASPKKRQELHKQVTAKFANAQHQKPELSIDVENQQYSHRAAHERQTSQTQYEGWRVVSQANNNAENAVAQNSIPLRRDHSRSDLTNNSRPSSVIAQNH